MVNLFEPIILNFLKKKDQSTYQTKVGSAPREDLRAVFKNIPLTAQALTENYKNASDGNVIAVRDLFFSPLKMSQWIEASKEKGIETRELKWVWNFLYPNIPWCEERIEWKDQKRKKNFLAFPGQWKESLYFCILFDSLKTGKIWIFFQWEGNHRKHCKISFQVENPATCKMLDREKVGLGRQLKKVVDVSISIDSQVLSLSQDCERGRGLLA